jgi:hypothetical protein
MMHVRITDNVVQNGAYNVSCVIVVSAYRHWPGQERGRSVVALITHTTARASTAILLGVIDVILQSHMHQSHML